MESKIRYVALPKVLDPIPVRKAGAGAMQLSTPDEGPLAKIEIPDNLSGSARKRILDWVAANPEEAAELVDLMVEHERWGGSDGAPDARRRKAGHGFVIEATRRARALA